MIIMPEDQTTYEGEEEAVFLGECREAVSIPHSQKQKLDTRRFSRAY